MYIWFSDFNFDCLKRKFVYWEGINVDDFKWEIEIVNGIVYWSISLSEVKGGGFYLV